MNKHRIFSRAAAVLIAFALIMTALIPAAEISASAATTDSTLRKTRITGYDTSRNKQLKSDVTVTATIKPAYGRTVMLQRYNSYKKCWVTAVTTTAEDTYKSEISLSIPKKNRCRTTSYWRIYAPKTDTAAGAVSSRITLTTRNIRNRKLSARSACIYRIDGNGEGTLIYTKKANTKRAQASTTKLMTAVLLLESGRLNSKTKISAHAVSTPWASGRMKQGDVYYTKDLLYAMLLPSSNDAATAVAERVGGTEKAFVSKMNAKAKAMGWKKTQFRNPHGLDADGHYTTAKELAKLTAYAYTFPEIRSCWATKVKTIKSVKLKRSWTLWSTNAIFGYIANFLGGKTGTEDNAGCCFTGIYKYGGSTYVTVVLGSGYGFSRWSDTQKLHDYIRTYAAGRY